MNKKIIGIIMIVLTLSILIAWEVWGEEYFLYEEIAVLKNDVQENTIIRKDMIKTIKVEKPNERVLKKEDIGMLLGMQSRQFIPRDEELYMEFFTANDLAYGSGTNLNVFSIPSNWVIDYPETLKRGDRAIFYSNGKYISECIVIHVKNEKNEEIQYSDINRQVASGNIYSVEVLATDEQIELFSELVNEENTFLITYK